MSTTTSRQLAQQCWPRWVPTLLPSCTTLHWDLHKHPELYETFDGGGRVFVNAA